LEALAESWRANCTARATYQGGASLAVKPPA